LSSEWGRTKNGVGMSEVCVFLVARRLLVAKILHTVCITLYDSSQSTDQHYAIAKSFIINVDKYM